jgi:histidinol-phosphate/aromatic aminotransferase/cobyric acid decarboxylase-like protein
MATLVTVAAARCEHGGASFTAIGDEFDDLSRRCAVIAADVLDAWFDPAPEVLDALRDHLAWSVRSSPPASCEGFVRAVARARGVHEDCIVPGAGSSALIYLALTRWLSRESRALILEPTYGEYAHVLHRVIGCRVDTISLREENGFAVPLGELRSKLASGRYDLAAIVNPNNPTGTVIRRADLEPVIAAAHERTIVWVDEAYCEYAETCDSGNCGAGVPPAGSAAGGGRLPHGKTVTVEPLAAASLNIVVCKTLSKVYALSGLRAAYLCGPAPLMAELRKLTPPWAIPLPAQIAAVRALACNGYYQARWRETHALRADLATALRGLAPWRVIEGCLNSVLCLLTPGMPLASELVRACRNRGVYLRDCANLCPAFDGGAVRIAVRSEEENVRVVDAIRSAPP